MIALIEKKKEFYDFSAQMWIKIVSSKEKHKNDSFDSETVKNQLIDEILECFMIKNIFHRIEVRRILKEACIDKKELVDLANMSFAMSVAIESETL